MKKALRERLVALLGTVTLVTIAACARQSTDVIVAESDREATHAAVVAGAHRSTQEALDHLSLALPPMDAPAEREGWFAEAALETRTGPVDEEVEPGMTKEPEPPAPGAKAKAAPAPAHLGPPRSAAEAAERTDQGTPQPAPTETALPRPASPTAPAETTSPSR